MPSLVAFRIHLGRREIAFPQFRHVNASSVNSELGFSEPQRGHLSRSFRALTGVLA